MNENENNEESSSEENEPLPVVASTSNQDTGVSLQPLTGPLMEIVSTLSNSGNPVNLNIIQQHVNNPTVVQQQVIEKQDNSTSIQGGKFKDAQIGCEVKQTEPKSRKRQISDEETSGSGQGSNWKDNLQAESLKNASLMSEIDPSSAKRVKLVDMEIVPLMENTGVEQEFFRENLTEEMQTKKSLPYQLNYVSTAPIDIKDMFSKAKSIADEQYQHMEETEAKSKIIEEKGNIVGLIAPAGAGKTVFIKAFIKKIAEQNPFMSNIKFLFYIDMKKVKLEKELSLFHFLVDYSDLKGKVQTPANEHDLSDLNNEEVLILFDGLPVAVDPFLNTHLTSGDASSEDFIGNILNGSILPRALKILASRPREMFSLNSSLRPLFILRLVGLNKNAQKGICEKLCGSQSQKVQKYFELQPSISEICSVPAHCISVCKTLESISNTTTSILLEVLKSFCRSSHVSDSEKVKNEILKDLTALAWLGLREHKTIFSKTDFEEAKANCLSLQNFLNTFVTSTLNSDENILKEDQYSYFLHFIWQHFFAAVHLIQDDLQNQFIDYVKDYLFDKKWEYVARFLFGFCHTKTMKQIRLKFSFSSNIGSKNVKILQNYLEEFEIDTEVLIEDQIKSFLQICSLLYEAQYDGQQLNKVTCLTKDNLVFRLMGIFLPSDYVHLSYVFEKLQRDFHIKFDLNYAGDELEKFVDIIRSSPKVKVRVFSNDYAVTLDNIAILAKIWPSITEANFEQNSFEEDKFIECLHKLMETLQEQPNIKINLNLGYIRFGDEFAKELAKTMNKFNELYVNCCDITSVGIKPITISCKSLVTNITVLCLSGNPIGDDGAKFLAEVINKFKKLEVVNCEITSAGVGALCEGCLNLENPMEKLSLSENKFGDIGAKYLANVIGKFKHLVIDECDITHIGANELCDSIKKLSNPISVSIKLNNLGYEGALSFSTCLKNIPRLEIFGCQLTKEGETILCQAISEQENKTELDLSLPIEGSDSPEIK